MGGAGAHSGTAAVAQIFNLLYRRFVTCQRSSLSEAPADYKSAIQQVINLRYGDRGGIPSAGEAPGCQFNDFDG